MRRRLPALVRLAGGGALAAILATVLTGCFSAPPQIIALEPNRGSTSVAADAPVRVTFDRQVTHSSVAGRFSVTPTISGCDLARVFSASSTAPCWIHWLDTAPGFELLHEGAVFAPATRYVFTLAAGIADPSGDSNGLDHHWDLTTAAAPVLSSTSPADRSTGVALDAPLTLSFNAPMDAPSTAAAISLDPPVAGTRVVHDTAERSRFEVLPGQYLDPGISYTLTVGAGARGEDQQPLAAAYAVRFTTGRYLAGAHAAVLAGTPGEASTEVLAPSLSPPLAGQPVAAPVILSAPLCQLITGCDGVPALAPLQTYASAAISPDGERLAVVVDDVRSASSSLEVLDAVDDSIIALIPSGSMPSWSPDGSQLAVVTPGQVEVLDAATGQTVVVAAGTTTTVPPLWSTAASLVISPTPAGAPATVELVDRQLGARYDLPGAPPGAVAAAMSPSGARVALQAAGGVTVLVPVGAGTGAPQRLAGRLQPLGFTGDGTLVALEGSGDATSLVLVSAAGGDTSTVGLSPGSADLQTVRVAPDGRRFALLAVDGSGVRQAEVVNSDGSNLLALTRFLPGGLQAQAVSFSY